MNSQCRVESAECEALSGKCYSFCTRRGLAAVLADAMAIAASSPASWIIGRAISGVTKSSATKIRNHTALSEASATIFIFDAKSFRDRAWHAPS